MSAATHLCIVSLISCNEDQKIIYEGIGNYYESESASDFITRYQTGSDSDDLPAEYRHKAITNFDCFVKDPSTVGNSFRWIKVKKSQKLIDVSNMFDLTNKRIEFRFDLDFSTAIIQHESSSKGGNSTTVNTVAATLSELAVQRINSASLRTQEDNYKRKDYDDDDDVSSDSDESSDVESKYYENLDEYGGDYGEVEKSKSSSGRRGNTNSNPSNNIRPGSAAGNANVIGNDNRKVSGKNKDYQPNYSDVSSGSDDDDDDDDDD